MNPPRVEIEARCPTPRCGNELLLRMNPGTPQVFRCRRCAVRYQVVSTDQPIGLARGGSGARYALNFERAPTLSELVQDMLENPPPPIP